MATGVSSYETVHDNKARENGDMKSTGTLFQRRCKVTAPSGDAVLTLTSSLAGNPARGPTSFMRRFQREAHSCLAKMFSKLRAHRGPLTDGLALPLSLPLFIGCFFCVGTFSSHSASIGSYVHGLLHDCLCKHSILHLPSQAMHSIIPVSTSVSICALILTGYPLNLALIVLAQCTPGFMTT